MREVDLELDFCPKCAPEETQNPFPVQEHRFYNSFAAVVQCTRCGTHYAASPRFGIIITLSCGLWFWGSFSLANSWNSPLTTIVLFLLALILYILNLQGDVVQIIDANGVMQAEYIYSPWGEVISAEGDLAEINPLRYRGYYYDSETGFYYLQSRYYDPENHRFINADTYASTDSGNSIASNMFAYCGNNPIIRSDDDGQFWHIIVGAVIGATVGAISAAIQGKGTAGILAGAVLGAASGALAASGAGVVAQTIGSGVLSMAENAIDQVEDIAKDKTNKKKFSVGSMLIDGAIGAVAGAAGGNGASYGNAKSINQAGKQLLKRGLLNPQARAYYAKVAHNAAKEYVFAPLLKSLGYGTIGKAVSAFANWAESRW